MRTYARLTVNVTRRTHEALNDTAQLTEHTRTDVVNHALQTYAMLVREQASGGRIEIRHPDGTTTAIRLLRIGD